MEDGSEKSNSGNKKLPLEELDKDELIKRCKNYLVLAQRAKSAKDDAQQRENELLGRISSLEEKICKLEENDTIQKIKIEEAVKEKNIAADELAELTDELRKKEDENNVLCCKSKEIQAELDSVEDNFGQQKEGFVEELNKMNVVLKQRGETITRLEEKCQSNEKEFKAKMETLLQSVAERERKIEQLEIENNRLETQSEVMSTSTVSKAEEIHRMKDVEDSLEDRYNKLKMLAVRMKKKIAEQSSLLQEKEKKLAVLNSNEEKVSNINNRNTPLNLQAMQKDIDRLNDELDSRKSQMTVLRKDFENAVGELAGSKQKAEEYKNEAMMLRTSGNNLEKVNKSLEKSVQEFKMQYENALKENETDKILRLELSKECDRLRNEVRQLNGTIEELNQSNEVAKQDLKKQTFLQLEIVDYEKTLSDLNIQLESLRKELKEKQNVAEQVEEGKASFEAQIKFLEQQVGTEQQRASESKMALDAIQLQLETYQNETQQQKLEIRQLTVKAEAKGSEVDSLRLELSLANAELQRAQTGSALHLESLRNQVATLEQAAAAEQLAKENLQRCLSELQSEYESYKIRATSVLKKQKTEGQTLITTQEVVGDFNTDQVEREMLQRVVEALKAKLADLESQLALSQSEVSSLRAERERIAAVQVATVQAAQQRLERAENELETTKREHKAQIARMQSDNQLLAALHREQIDALKLRHTQEILALQNDLDAAGEETIRLQKLASQTHRTNSPLVKVGNQLRDEFGMEREQGEGSEDGSVSLRQRKGSSGGDVVSRKPMPLDQLLNSSLVVDETDILLQPVSESPALTSDQFFESLSVSEKRCRHLAALLAESEANEARLSQLADALKEEIRRTQRSEERQKHIENLEYLKNVVLKFVTLPRGEERGRLIPVLTTLLRLSPQEVQQVHQTYNRNVETAVRPAAWGGVFNYFAPNQ